MPPLPLPNREDTFSTSIDCHYVTSSILWNKKIMYAHKIHAKRILWFIPIGKMSPLLPRLQIHPCQKHITFVGFPCSIFEYELEFFYFFQLFVQKPPFLAMDGDPYCENFNNLWVCVCVKNNLPLNVFRVSRIMPLSFFISVIHHRNRCYKI